LRDGSHNQRKPVSGKNEKQTSTGLRLKAYRDQTPEIGFKQPLCWGKEKRVILAFYPAVIHDGLVKRLLSALIVTPEKTGVQNSL
jgi:hypothetical protein